MEGAKAVDRVDSRAKQEELSQAIVVENVHKAYGSKRAVDGIRFSVQSGEIFALLGPNGAGKTTTLEILEGYRQADRGTIRVLGVDPRRDTQFLHKSVGVMLQQDGLQPGLTAREVLGLYASFFAHPLDVDGLLNRVGLQEAASTRCRRLSGGQKRRLALAVALVGRPKLVFLDEPTTGMDPQARLATWEAIRALRDEGTTVIFTTHLMDEAERLADRVAIMADGHIVALDTPQALMHRTSNRVQLRATPGLDTGALAQLPHATSVREVEPGLYSFDAKEMAALLAELTAWLRDEGITLHELRTGYQSLEEIFLQLTAGDERL